MSARDDDQRDKLDLINSTGTTTYHREALIALGLENQGRFGQTAGVIGSVADAGSQYPRLPGNSPYAFDPVPPEEALGYSVEDQLVCGTPAEVQQSIDALSIEASSTVVGSGDEASFAASSSLSGDASDGGDALENADGFSSSFTNPQQSRASLPTPSTSLVIKRRKGL